MNGLQVFDNSTLLQRIESKYRAQGYAVEENPTSASLPFDLAGYKPSLIARAPDGGGLIIEVASGQRLPSADTLVEVADIVRSHPSWRFIVATGDGVPNAVDAADDELLGVEEIRERLDQLYFMREGLTGEALFLQAWPLLEATLRHRALSQNYPVERLGPRQLIQYLYSMGFISGEQYDALNPLLPVRSRIVHGYTTDNADDAADTLLSILGEILNEQVST